MERAAAPRTRPQRHAASTQTLFTMPLKSVRITVNVPGEISELIERRMKEEKYPSISAFFVGLALYDLYARKPHLLTGALMREPQYIRDEVIAELVRDFDNAEKKPGSWFEHRIEELIAQRKSET
jgi:Arc/MetJ-type ribon-helix-helix transcriptional regulator